MRALIVSYTGAVLTVWSEPIHSHISFSLRMADTSRLCHGVLELPPKGTVWARSMVLTSLKGEMLDCGFSSYAILRLYETVERIISREWEN